MIWVVLIRWHEAPWERMLAGGDSQCYSQHGFGQRRWVAALGVSEVRIADYTIPQADMEPHKGCNDFCRAVFGRMDSRVCNVGFGGRPDRFLLFWVQDLGAFLPGLTWLVHEPDRERERERVGERAEERRGEERRGEDRGGERERQEKPKPKSNTKSFAAQGRQSKHPYIESLHKPGGAKFPPSAMCCEKNLSKPQIRRPYSRLAALGTPLGV